eukprot:gene12138-biopygen11150
MARAPERVPRIAFERWGRPRRQGAGQARTPRSNARKSCHPSPSRLVPELELWAGARGSAGAKRAGSVRSDRAVTPGALRFGTLRLGRRRAAAAGGGVALHPASLPTCDTQAGAAGISSRGGGAAWTCSGGRGAVTLGSSRFGQLGAAILLRCIGSEGISSVAFFSKSPWPGNPPTLPRGQRRGRSAAPRGTGTRTRWHSSTTGTGEDDWAERRERRRSGAHDDALSRGRCGRELRRGCRWD